MGTVARERKHACTRTGSQRVCDCERIPVNCALDKFRVCDIARRNADWWQSDVARSCGDDDKKERYTETCLSVVNCTT